MTTFLFFMALCYLILKLSKDKKAVTLLKKWDELVQEGIADIQKANQQADKKTKEDAMKAWVQERQTTKLKTTEERKNENVEDAIIISEEKANPTSKEAITELKTKSQPKPKIISEQKQTVPPQRTDFVEQLMKELGLTEVKNNPKQPKEWTLELLMSLEWKRFEEVCRDYFIATGLDARLTRSGADGGVDIQIYENNQIVCLIQCKAWTWKIGVKEIRELYGIMASEKVNNGIFITTSSYTQDAIIFSKEKNVRLFDGKDLIKRIKMLPPDQQEKLLTFATAGDYTTPTCARCKQKMVRRTGKDSGKDFWGCVNFPRCRSTIQIRKAA